VLDPSATFLVGENGSGKSTLLEAIAAAAGLNAEGGGRNFRFSTFQTETSLHRHLRLVRSGAQPRTDFFLRAETFYNVASEVERLSLHDSYGGSLHERSHGESFLALALHRFGPEGLYLLDEPEAALSPQGQLALLRRLHDLVEEGSQLIVATHSPILLAFPGARILACDDDGLRETAYDDVAGVGLYRSFLGSPERFLRHLLADDDG
jgi:predicted ATPase